MRTVKVLAMKCIVAVMGTLYAVLKLLPARDKAVFISSYVITVTNTTPLYGAVTLTYTESGESVQTGSRIDEGTSLTIKATPRSYKELSSLTINGEEHAADYSDGYTFVVEGTTNISVTFAVTVWSPGVARASDVSLTSLNPFH